MLFSPYLAAIAVFAVPLLAHASPSKREEFNIVDGKYMILLKRGVDLKSLAAHHDKVREIHARNVESHPESPARSVKDEFGFGDFHGYFGHFDEATIEELKRLPEVTNVQKDRILRLGFVDSEDDEDHEDDEDDEDDEHDEDDEDDEDDTSLLEQHNAPHGLATISARSGHGKHIYIYKQSPAVPDTFAYVVDTGIRLTHQEFGGRAIFGYNAVTWAASESDPVDDIDHYGHGTHVAGIIGGSTYGVAKNTTLVSVKVFQEAIGTESDTIRGLNWAIKDIINNNRTSSSVINLSLGGGKSSIMDEIMHAAADEGVLVVCAAGNEGEEASKHSPAGSPYPITVGSIRKNLARYAKKYGSNYGPEVNIFAPGSHVISAHNKNDSDTLKLSGTSMATPHVAGLVNYIQRLEGPLSSEKAKLRLFELATSGVVTDLKGCQDRLAYNGNGR